jgi:hypothetical protein
MLPVHLFILHYTIFYRNNLSGISFTSFLYGSGNIKERLSNNFYSNPDAWKKVNIKAIYLRFIRESFSSCCEFSYHEYDIYENVNRISLLGLLFLHINATPPQLSAK